MKEATYSELQTANVTRRCKQTHTCKLVDMVTVASLTLPEELHDHARAPVVLRLGSSSETVRLASSADTEPRGQVL